MHIHFKIDRSAVMFLIGIALTIVSLSTMAVARQSKTTRWDYRIVQASKGSEVLRVDNGWEPVNLAYDGDHWPQVLLRRAAR